MDLLSKAIGSLFLGLADAIRAIGIKGIPELVFLCMTPGMKGTSCSAPPEGTFWPQEWTSIMSWYWVFSAVALTPALVQAVVTVYGLRVAVASGNSKARTDLYQLLSGFVGMFFLILATPFVVRWLLGLDVGLTQLMAAKLGPLADVFGNIRDFNKFEQQLRQFGAVEALNAIRNNKLLFGAMQLVIVGVELMMNFLYFIRKLVIGISLILIPLAGWVLVFRHTYTPLLLLLSEIASNAFMHASHAAAIVILTEIAIKNTDKYQWWILLFSPTALPVLSAFVRRLFTGYLNYLGVNEEKWAGWAALGVGSLVALGKAGTGILGAAGAAGAAKAAGAVARAAGFGGGGGVAGPMAVPLSTLLGGSGPAGSGTGGLAGTVARTAGAASAGGGTISIPLNPGATSLLGGSAVERPTRGSLTPGSPGWVTGLQTPGNILQVGESPPPVAQVRDTQMALSQSGLWLPASVAAQQAQQQGGQASGATANGQRGSVATDVLAAVGRSGVRGAEIAFKGSAVVASALVGAGLAAYGGPGAAAGAIEAGRQLADAAWSAPQRVVMTARDIYQRVRERREAAAGAGQVAQGSGLVVAGRMPAPVVRAGAVGPVAARP